MKQLALAFGLLLAAPAFAQPPVTTVDQLASIAVADTPLPPPCDPPTPRGPTQPGPPSPAPPCRPN